MSFMPVMTIHHQDNGKVSIEDALFTELIDKYSENMPMSPVTTTSPIDTLQRIVSVRFQGRACGHLHHARFRFGLTGFIVVAHLCDGRRDVIGVSVYTVHFRDWPFFRVVNVIRL